MQRLFFLLAFLILSSSVGWASHIRAGEITAERISNSTFTYKLTLVVYTKSSSGINIDEATLNASPVIGSAIIWSDTVPFTDTVNLGNDVTRARYEFTATFNVGAYRFWFRDENRVEGVLNMDQSLNTAFYIETLVTMDPGLGLNTSPILLVPPIDDGSTNQIYNYNPGAFDADGDSLTYEMDIPMRDTARDVINYIDPGLVAGTNPVTLDTLLGNLEWDVPLVPGEYNIAYRIYEWRNGNLIGYIHRDMQITIVDNNNNKPELNIPDDTCVVSGSTLNVGIGASDPDGDALVFEAYGGVIPPATFVDTSFGFNYGGRFTWTPGCLDVREDPYQIVFKASDSPSKDPNLVDIQSWNVKVSGPKVSNVLVNDLVSPFGLSLTWDTYSCTNASTINIYRKGCSSGGDFDVCVEITPEDLGFELVGTVDANVSSFLDTAVTKGQQYCYVLQVEFPAPEFGKSIVSDESCAIAGANFPLMTKVSVTRTDELQGSIRVEWQDPLDTNITINPANVVVWRSVNDTTNFVSLGTFPTRSILDTGLNTVDNQYHYKVIHQTSESDAASSVFLTATGTSGSVSLSWDAEVPWENGRFLPLHLCKIWSRHKSAIEHSR